MSFHCRGSSTTMSPSVIPTVATWFMRGKKPCDVEGKDSWMHKYCGVRVSVSLLLSVFSSSLSTSSRSAFYIISAVTCDRPPTARHLMKFML